MFSGVYWDHPARPSVFVYPSVYKILVSVKVLAWILTLSQRTNARKFSKRIENAVGKGEIARYK